LQIDREQTERIALAYSVLLDGAVQGCVYVQPLASALRSRELANPSDTANEGDLAVCGWLHDRPAIDLVKASMAWLGSPPFEFPRLWWLTNSQCPDQLAACAELGLSRVLTVPGADRTWEMRS